MPSENTTNAGVKRRHAIAKMLLNYSDYHPDAFYIFFKEDEILYNPLLQSYSAYTKALKRMQEDLSPDFEYQEIWEGGGGSGDVGFTSQHYVGIGVSIDNWDKLAAYRKELEKEIGEQGKTAVTIDFNRGIFRTDEEKVIYMISGMRKKIVEYISKKNGVRQKEIASLTGRGHLKPYSDSQISTEISAINKMFKNKLFGKSKVAPDLIKHNPSHDGYHLNEGDLTITRSKVK